MSNKQIELFYKSIKIIYSKALKFFELQYKFRKSLHQFQFQDLNHQSGYQSLYINQFDKNLENITQRNNFIK